MPSSSGHNNYSQPSCSGAHSPEASVNGDGLSSANKNNNNSNNNTKVRTKRQSQQGQKWRRQQRLSLKNKNTKYFCESSVSSSSSSPGVRRDGSPGRVPTDARKEGNANNTTTRSPATASTDNNSNSNDSNTTDRRSAVAAWRQPGNAIPFIRCKSGEFDSRSQSSQALAGGGENNTSSSGPHINGNAKAATATTSPTTTITTTTTTVQSGSIGHGGRVVTFPLRRFSGPAEGEAPEADRRQEGDGDGDQAGAAPQTYAAAVQTKRLPLGRRMLHNGGPNLFIALPSSPVPSPSHSEGEHSPHPTGKPSMMDKPTIEVKHDNTDFCNASNSSSSGADIHPALRVQRGVGATTAAVRRANSSRSQRGAASHGGLSIHCHTPVHTPVNNNTARRPNTVPGDESTTGCKIKGRALDAFTAAEVLPGLFLGSYADAMNISALVHHHVSLVIDVAVECPVTVDMANNNDRIRYLQFPLRDHSDEVISPFFAPITHIIHEQLHRRKAYLERCEAHGNRPGNDCAAPLNHSASLRSHTDISTGTPPGQQQQQQGFTSTPTSRAPEPAGHCEACGLPEVLDPRDCGGVLVHCRMGVSRSASFILAYLILYGETLAKLEDAETLFADTFRSERAAVRRAEELTRRYCEAELSRSGGSKQLLSADASEPDKSAAPKASTQHNTVVPGSNKSAMPKCSPLHMSYTSFGSPLNMNSASCDLLTPREAAAKTCWPCFQLRRAQFQQQKQQADGGASSNPPTAASPWTTTSTWSPPGGTLARRQQPPQSGSPPPRCPSPGNALGAAADAALFDVMSIQSPLSTRDVLGLFSENHRSSPPRVNVSGDCISISGYTPATPGMGYREAFEFLKDRKPDVNPNIGFVLALRELAGGGDFSLSTSTQ